MTSDDIRSLRDEITRLLAAAAQADVDNAEALRVAEAAHQAEIAELVAMTQRATNSQAERTADREHDYEVQVANLRLALESRDLIGQAKGVLMVTKRCTADQAFAMLVKQSQHENRKVVEIAADIIKQTNRRVTDT
jgi:hypothetical protein